MKNTYLIAILASILATSNLSASEFQDSTDPQTPTVLETSDEHPLQKKQMITSS